MRYQFFPRFPQTNSFFFFFYFQADQRSFGQSREFRQHLILIFSVLKVSAFLLFSFTNINLHNTEHRPNSVYFLFSSYISNIFRSSIPNWRTSQNFPISINQLCNIYAICTHAGNHNVERNSFFLPPRDFFLFFFLTLPILCSPFYFVAPNTSWYFAFDISQNYKKFPKWLG